MDEMVYQAGMVSGSPGVAGQKGEQGPPGPQGKKSQDFNLCILQTSITLHN